MTLKDLYPDIERLTLFVAFEEADAEAEPNYQQIIFTGDSIPDFRLDCSREDCVGGGFDYAPFIDELIQGGQHMVQGKLSCQGSLDGEEGNSGCNLHSEYRIMVQPKL